MSGVWELIAAPVLKIIDKVIPDPAAKAAAQLELVRLQQTGELAELKADLDLSLAQISVNNTEAQSPSLFVSGWRPFVGWMCATGLGFQVLLAPLLEWGSDLLGHATVFPMLDTSLLWTMLAGMLGIGGMRTFEKLQGVARQ